ncbi:unnamed protein product [Spirodela intermedia]|uniref:Uncharacterized protein n=1 Tax=Spirodela intermedia TaxID=51605 RepID=A0A7I8JM79_SPIIN|nr:unnamed protein product [Spirodela intermedia]CAA6670683.1 unnamed protein product [Spirodela intermedia]
MVSAAYDKGDGELAAHALVFPFPSQGHMIPLLDLAHHLSLQGVSVTVLVTPGNLPILRRLLSRAPVIKTLVLPFPPHPSLPAGVENSKDLTADQFLPLMHALSFLHEPFLRWARTTPSPPDFIVSDFFLGWTQRTAAELGVPRVAFCPSGALFLSVVHDLWREMPQRGGAAAGEDFPVEFPSLPGSPVFPWRHLSSLYRREGFLQNISSWGYVFNTFKDLEAPYLDHLRAELGHRRVWAVGPLAPPGDGDRDGDSVRSAGAVAWLDACPAGTVVYVCFGSQAELNPAQTAALAAALERSGSRFVWCLRVTPAGSAVAYGGAPEGFEKRTAGRGCFPHSLRLELGDGGDNRRRGPPDMADERRPVRDGKVAGGGRSAVGACEGPDSVPDPDELARVIAESVGGRRSEAAESVRLRKKAMQAVAEGGSSSDDLRDLVTAIFQDKIGQGIS